MAKLGFASPTLGFNIVHDDGSVTTNGELNTGAIVTGITNGET